MGERCAAIGSGRLLPACTGQANREYRLPDGWSIIAAGNRERTRPLPTGCLPHYEPHGAP
ncbi:MAG: hypothetical protein ACLSHC_17320 [Bilophila wadsworthia]